MRSSLEKLNLPALKDLAKKLGRHDKEIISKEKLISKILKEHQKELIEEKIQELRNDKLSTSDKISKKNYKLAVIGLVVTAIIGVGTLYLSKKTNKKDESLMSGDFKVEAGKDIINVLKKNKVGDSNRDINSAKYKYRMILRKLCDTCYSGDMDFVIIPKNDSFELSTVKDYNTQFSKGKILFEPSYLTPWLNGTELMFDKKYQEAVAQFESMSLELKPAYLDVYFKLGVCNFFLKKYKLASEYLKKVLLIDSNNALAHGGLGILFHTHLNDTSIASKHYTRAVELKPDYILCYNNLGIIYSKSGKYELAKKMYEESLRYEQNDPEVYYNIAANYARQNNKIKVIENLEKSFKLGLPYISETFNDVVFKKYYKDNDFINLVKNYSK